MAKNKSPGPDGLPIEFYLKFSFRILPNSKYIAVIYDRVHYSVGGKKVVTHATPRTEGLSVFWIRTTKSLDQEKAFDKVDHKFLFAVQVLESSNMTMRFQINGFLSKQIAVKRRVRQGCPLSPFYILYIYCILEPILRINPGLKSYNRKTKVLRNPPLLRFFQKWEQEKNKINKAFSWKLTFSGKIIFINSRVYCSYPPFYYLASIYLPDEDLVTTIRKHIFIFVVPPDCTESQTRLLFCQKTKEFGPSHTWTWKLNLCVPLAH